MKQSIIILVVFICTIVIVSMSNAQDILVFKKSSERIITSVSAVGGNSISTPSGMISYKEMDSVYLKTKREEDKSLLKRLSDAGVKILFHEFDVQSSSPGPTNKEDQFKKQVMEASGDLETRIERFRVQRTTGKTLQLIGYAGAIAASILVTDAKNANTAKSVALGAGVLGIAGFIIDLDAGNRLKKN